MMPFTKASQIKFYLTKYFILSFYKNSLDFKVFELNISRLFFMNALHFITLSRFVCVKKNLLFQERIKLLRIIFLSI